mgnify:CR=1 FL=1|jgi:hypothetical protein
MRLTESKLRKIIRGILSEKKFSELPGYGKNMPVELQGDITSAENPELRDEIIDLINKSYSYTKAGRNYDYSQADDLVNNYDLTSLLAWDIDDDPDPDVIRGMKTKGGKQKLTISGNDGSPQAVAYGTADTEARLRDGNHFAEMSGRSAGSMMRAGIPAITDEATVRSLLPGKEITWYGKHPDCDSIAAKKSAQYCSTGTSYDGWYLRNVSGTDTLKMMFGAVGPGSTATEEV